ncbi:pectinesterase family protein [Ponticaulis sp.]|uniref:pectinesterase family protein n=1 Tax=Ponticaulis sp. TaxID=2020902 RepID=UPI000C3C0126|nr:pectinesterase family protein [Ponticaulis sp.]MBN02709.1 hypothetical protein [Ponticaulis sp.]
MKIIKTAALIASGSLALIACSQNTPAPEAAVAPDAMFFPANDDTGISPDTPLRITFPDPLTIHSEGVIEITDAETGEVVDRIDVSIPFGPFPDGRMSGATQEDRIRLGRESVMSDYQVNTLQGVDFHYHPVLAFETTAIITPHNGALGYGETYNVHVDGDVFGLSDRDFEWSFATRDAPPDADTGRVTVASDGSGDFVTVQGALDFAPAESAEPFEIFVRNGRYDELVFLNGKSDIILRGESRDGVVVRYPNNSAFNPPRGNPSRRPAFQLYEVSDIQLSDFTIQNDFIGQAEALLVRGDRVIIDNMQLNGSGDALTTYGSIYMQDSELIGDGDTILGYATLFCLRCTIKSVGPFTWTRTREGQHGNIFVDSEMIYLDQPLPWSVTDDNPEGQKTRGVLARLPFNGPREGPRHERSNFPFAEMVLINTRTDGIPPEGWGPVEEEHAEFSWENIHLWEFNTMDMEGNPVDMSERHPLVRVLDAEADAELIANYSDPTFILNGWTPEVK